MEYGLNLSICHITQEFLDLLVITNFFLDRETNIVHVFHADTAEWTFQENKLPKPLFSHGCNLVTLKDGRSGILTVGGFTTEGIPAVIPNTKAVSK